MAKVYMAIYQANMPNVVYEDLDSAKNSFDKDITWELKDDYYIGVVDGELNSDFTIQEFSVL